MRVSIHAFDPVAELGLIAYMTDEPEVTVCSSEADVRLIAVDRLTPHVIAELRRLATEAGTPAVLVSAETEEIPLMAVVSRCQVAVVIAQHAATRQRVLEGVRIAARAGGVVPPKVLGALLRIAPLRSGMGVSLPVDSPLNPREVAVLQRLAEGWNAAPIADELGFSDSTAKKVVQGVVRRLQLRNRTHAVAYAIRHGLI